MAVIYNILKCSYHKDNGVKFMDNLLFVSAVNEDMVKQAMIQIISSSDIKDIETDVDDEKDIIRVTYKQEFEQEFFHGFSIQQIDLSTGSQKYLNREDPLYNELCELIRENIKKEG